MIYFIRHSERIDVSDPNKWKKSERYKENENDPFLSSNGKKIAVEQLKKLMDSKFGSDIDCINNIDFIYTSPFSRCIETSIEFRKYILKKYKIDVKIRVDYGLCPQIPGDWIFWFSENKNNIVFKNGNFEIKQTTKFLDNQLKQKNIYKRYNGEDNFDCEYESTVSFDDINNEFSSSNSYEKSVNNRIKSINEITKNLNKFSLICTHGEVIMLVKNLLEKKWKNDEENLFGGKNYCSGLECKKVKGKLLLSEIIKGNLY